MLMEYWETCDASQGGVIIDIFENGLSVRSLSNMDIGAELRMGIFFSVGNEFYRLQVLTKITGKELGCEEGWEVYIYELTFIEISDQDRLKLKHLLSLRQEENVYS